MWSGQGFRGQALRLPTTTYKKTHECMDRVLPTRVISGVASAASDGALSERHQHYQTLSLPFFISVGGERKYEQCLCCIICMVSDG